MKQWETQDAWNLIYKLQEKHNAKCSFIGKTWHFYQNGNLVKTCELQKDVPLCWQMYSLFLDTL